MKLIINNLEDIVEILGLLSNCINLESIEIIYEYQASEDIAYYFEVIKEARGILNKRVDRIGSIKIIHKKATN